ncbi:MAG: PAN domain-containing protein [Rhizobiaceae bacterium]
MLRPITMAMTALFALFLALGPSLAYENKTDRPGGDYKSFDIVIPKSGTIVSTATMCESKCKSELQCYAWTLVDRGVQGPNARCWLKNSIPEPRPCSFCTSGSFRQKMIRNSF